MSTETMPWWKEPTKGQWASFTAAWLGWVMDAFDFTVFLLVMKQITEEFGVTYTSTAGTIALTLLMRLVGGVVAGWAADRWGRKLPLMISVIWFAVCDGLIAVAPSFTWVLVLRTLFGFGMGAEWTSGATLAMENWPQRSRGIASGILQGSWAVGYLLAGVAAGLVVPVYGWRTLFLLAAVPALLALPIRFLVPESPEWEAGKAKGRSNEVSWREIAATPGVLKRLAWGSVAMAAGFGGYYALTGNYSVLLLKNLGQSMQGVSWHVALFNLGMLSGAIACGYVAMKKGVTLAVAVPALSMVVVTPLYVGVAPELLAVGAYLAGVFGAGYSGVSPLLLTSLFPARFRARCVGIVYHVGAVPAAFVPMGIAYLAESGVASLPVGMGVVCAACQLGMAAMIVFAPKDAGASSATPSTDAALAH
ncbi:MAG: MFS transporter [Myxococcaceae bacterium]|jgi:SHS family lactate transporter-like MFS transporter|nr:MFS transporter [Myxococcaceae bacterium]